MNLLPSKGSLQSRSLTTVVSACFTLLALSKYSAIPKSIWEDRGMLQRVNKCLIINLKELTVHYLHLTGLMFDITLTWDLSFYMAGIWIVVSGILVGLIPATRNRVLWGSGSLELDMERDKSSNA
jgi:hypothetical protein